MIDSFWVAQIIFVIASLMGIIGVQQNKKRSILVFFAISTLLASVAFIFLEAYPGSLSLFMMSVFAVISYLFDKKKRDIPKWLVVVFIAITIALGSLTVAVVTDVLPIIASSCYVLAVVQKKERDIRIFTLVNLILWVIYDSITLALAAIITDGFFALSTAIAIIRFHLMPYIKNRRAEEAKKSSNN